MTATFAALLRCPRCRGILELRSDEQRGADVLRGALRCQGCVVDFPIVEGVPRMMPGVQVTATRRSFTFQWRLGLEGRLRARDAQFCHDPELMMRFHLEVALGRPAAGQSLLDLGCGTGENAAIAAREHPHSTVVALDLADTIGAVAAQFAHLSNLHFVQGDASALPFADGAFDKCMSWGVLHHTPDTRRHLLEAARVVARGGRLAVWIYPLPGEDRLFRHYYRLRDRVFLGRASLLPAWLRYRLLQAGTVVGFPYLWWLDRVVGVRQYRNHPYMLRLEGASLGDLYRRWVFLNFDNISPEFQHRHSRAEVLGWFSELGFTQTATDTVGHYWGVKPG